VDVWKRYAVNNFNVQKKKSRSSSKMFDSYKGFLLSRRLRGCKIAVRGVLASTLFSINQALISY
jgi:hypothetical protein